MGRYAKDTPEPGDPIAYPKKNKVFLPPPLSPPEDLTVSLESIAPGAAEAIDKHGEFVFHTVGDTGGIDGPETQEAIADAMQAQIESAGEGSRPRLLYILGDVIYQNGDPDEYRSQFYDPYQAYHAPIVSIPGNHDGYGREDVWQTTLDGWTENFMGKRSQPGRLSAYRDPIALPYYYWAADCPLFRIIGLYSNTEGFLDDPAKEEKPQQAWLAHQLASMPSDSAAIVTVHHPPYSFDSKHHGYEPIAKALDDAARLAGRWPDIVFSGHVHAMQRFARRIGDREVPYLIAGAGGRANERKKIAKPMDWKETGKIKAPFKAKPRDPDLKLKLVANDWKQPGFLKARVRKHSIKVEYWRVPFENPDEPYLKDIFELDLRSHTVRETA